MTAETNSSPNASTIASPNASWAIPLLQMEHITLSFSGVTAIRDISFKVERGEICAIIGPNGAGKSSLLNVINGVYHPQEGTIAFDGEVRTKMQPHHAALRGIGRTFQNIALFKGMTVLQNIMTGCNLSVRAGFFAQLLRLPAALRDERASHAQAEEIIALLQIEAHRDSIVGQLPYGLQKRVELGRALAAKPKLLLLDEPMAGMNSEEKQDMVHFIREANRHLGATVVLIEHDMSVVMDIAGHVVVLDYGRKIGDGAPDDVRNNPDVIDAYLGVSHEDHAVLH